VPSARGFNLGIANDGITATWPIVRTVMPLRVIAGHRGSRATLVAGISACFSWLIGFSPGIYPRAVPGCRIPCTEPCVRRERVCGSKPLNP
jgi:hypothetical protein